MIKEKQRRRKKKDEYVNDEKETNKNSRKKKNWGKNKVCSYTCGQEQLSGGQCLPTALTVCRYYISDFCLVSDEINYSAIKINAIS